MRPVFKIIIFYEIFFFAFWNIIYYSNSDVENWFEAKILTAIFTILSTMALGICVCICSLYQCKINRRIG